MDCHGLESVASARLGLVHAAGVLRDAGIAALRPSSFRVAAAPKAFGMWRLARVRRGHEDTNKAGSRCGSHVQQGDHILCQARPSTTSPLTKAHLAPDR